MFFDKQIKTRGGKEREQQTARVKRTEKKIKAGLGTHSILDRRGARLRLSFRNRTIHLYQENNKFSSTIVHLQQKKKKNIISPIFFLFLTLTELRSFG